jgi:hypothetical protein
MMIPQSIYKRIMVPISLVLSYPKPTGVLGSVDAHKCAVCADSVTGTGEFEQKDEWFN